MYTGNTNWIHEDIKKEKKDMILAGGGAGDMLGRRVRGIRKWEMVDDYDCGALYM